MAELDRLDCKEEWGLRDYTKLCWHVLEPDRPFVPGWHLDAIADHLTAVSRGEILRLLINVPPGCMKSLSTNVIWPSWEWGPQGQPGLRYVSAAYSQDLTVRDNRRTRTLIQSPWYQRRWPHVKLVSDQNAKTRYDTSQMGFRIATSVSGLGTGERGDRFVIDDPHNIKDGESNAKRTEVLLWFSEVVPTRLSDPEKSAIIVIMQRVHDEDVAGLILERELGYEHLMLPMEYEHDHPYKRSTTIGFADPRSEDGELLWPKRMTAKVVERDKEALGEYAAAGQFQQRPAPRGGGMFKKVWWRFYSGQAPYRPDGCDFDAPAVHLPGRKEFDWVGISIDSAFKDLKKGSRVGFLVAGGLGAMVYLLADYTAHMDFTKTVKLTQEQHAEWEPNFVLMEETANGAAIINVLGPEIAGLIPIKAEGGKDSRASAMTHQIRAGQVFLPEGERWSENVVVEHALFPSSAKNDRVDALSQLLIYVNANPHLAKARQLIKF